MIHNLVCFFGIDHKVGTTMISQSTAELISFHYPNLKILFISMNGRESTEYVREAPISIDAMKYYIDNKMIIGADFLKTCTHKGNFYMMSGISNELESRYYYPDTVRCFLNEIAPEFDIIIADCGSDLDNGLAIGALSVSEDIFLIISQQESAIRRFEKLKPLMAELNIKKAVYIINKYKEQDPYGLNYLSDRLNIGKDNIWKVASSDYYRQAEVDYKTLLEYKNEMYIQDISLVANSILHSKGFSLIKKQRKSRWKNFI
ncbi:MAG: hypothetical protein ACOX4V_10580 [Anaerovoracaceae bacterium]